jgi:hypothetical protein
VVVKKNIKTRFHRLAIIEDADYIRIKIYDPGSLLLKEIFYENNKGFGFGFGEEVKQSNNNILSLLDVGGVSAADIPF